MHRQAFLGLVLLSLLASGCATISGQGSSNPLRGKADSGTRLITVPFHPQEAYQCGPASLAMALGWSGIPLTPQALAPEVYLPSRKGSLQPALVGAVRRHGRVAYPVTGMEALLAELGAGHPVIVLQNLGLAWYPVWHFAVAVGYDTGRQAIILHTGTHESRPVGVRTFENTWARSGHWGLLALPPDRMPASAQESAYLAAVTGLEQAHQWDAAMTAYKAALKRWPASLVALVGLGNSAYSLGDLDSAETALREAVRRHPDSPVAANNLAQVLSDQGRQQEALEFIGMALAGGGGNSSLYEQTLRQIIAREGN